ncbi:MAG: hypothetical protein L3J93_05415 [Thermoplasmata archaeon]|nr:hypothetical protein [Thermoplasmata archaeon]
MAAIPETGIGRVFRIPRVGLSHPSDHASTLFGDGVWPVVNPRERELLTGMGNCYEACQDDFEGTVGMVAGARSLTREAVLLLLDSMRTRYSKDEDYVALRNRLPPEFPL